MLMPLQRRGLRAIKKMMPKATKASADGVVRPRNVSSQMTTPSAPIRNGTIFLMGAATPPSQVFARGGIRCHALVFSTCWFLNIADAHSPIAAEDIAHLCWVPDDWRLPISDLAAWPFPTPAVYGINTTFPVVRRPASSSCALAASESGKT